jgi:hypothetical protein
MRIASRRRLAAALAFALLLPALLRGEPARRPAANLVGWWQQPPTCAKLGIGEELRRRLAPQLEKLQTSYQIVQTRLAEARRRQSAMLADPAASREALLEWNRAEVVAASEKMQSLNFEARLLVRGQLGKEQLQALAERHPQFFAARWFKASALPVIEGRVVEEE